jgi:hypothetical protein
VKEEEEHLDALAERINQLGGTRRLGGRANREPILQISQEDTTMEGKILKGNMVISVHTEDGKEVDKAKEIFKREGAQDISYTGEAPVKAA